MENGDGSTSGIVTSDLEVMPPTALDAIMRSEIDVQIATAHRYPRSVQRFRTVALSMATLDPDTAAACFYKLARGGKSIEGPGVRLAEIVATAWGNLRCGARVIAEDDRFLTAQGYAHDLESNYAVVVEVRRRITDRTGKRYSDDMVGTTANAATAIARRNAVFGAIPRAYVEPIYQAAKRAAVGDEKTLAERRAKLMETFAGMGVTADRVLTRLGKPGIADVDLGDVETMIGIWTAIRDGDATIESELPMASPAATTKGADGGTRAAQLAKALSAKEPTPGGPQDTAHDGEPPQSADETKTKV